MLIQEHIKKVMTELEYTNIQEDDSIYVKIDYDDIKFIVVFDYIPSASLERYNNAIVMDSHSRSRSKDFSIKASGSFLYNEEELKNTIKRMEQRARFVFASMPMSIENI